MREEVVSLSSSLRLSVLNLVMLGSEQVDRQAGLRTGIVFGLVSQSEWLLEMIWFGND